jgi:hypothetical protein
MCSALPKDTNPISYIRFSCNGYVRIKFFKKIKKIHMLKVININSKYILTKAQESFTEAVIVVGEPESMKDYDSISMLMNEIPIFLLNEVSMPDSTKDSDYLGFYTETVLGYGYKIPAIYLCPERIMASVKTEDELLYLTTKIIIHEFGHAIMSTYPNPEKRQGDDFYKWMEEAMANLITLEYFHKFQSSSSHKSLKKFGHAYMSKNQTSTPFDYVRSFISSQPVNYILGNDLFNSSINDWKFWRNMKSNKEENEKKYEKANWVKYVSKNFGKCDPRILYELFYALK